MITLLYFVMILRLKYKETQTQVYNDGVNGFLGVYVYLNLVKVTVVHS